MKAVNLEFIIGALVLIIGTTGCQKVQTNNAHTTDMAESESTPPGGGVQENIRKHTAIERDSLPNTELSMENIEARGVSRRLNVRLLQLDDLMNDLAFKAGWTLQRMDWRRAAIKPTSPDTLASYVEVFEAEIKPESKKPEFLQRRNQWLANLNRVSTFDDVRIAMLELESGLKPEAFHTETFKRLMLHSEWKTMMKKPLETQSR